MKEEVPSASLYPSWLLLTSVSKMSVPFFSSLCPLLSFPLHWGNCHLTDGHAPSVHLISPTFPFQRLMFSPQNADRIFSVSCLRHCKYLPWPFLSELQVSFLISSFSCTFHTPSVLQLLLFPSLPRTRFTSLCSSLSCLRTHLSEIVPVHSLTDISFIQHGFLMCTRDGGRLRAASAYSLCDLCPDVVPMDFLHLTSRVLLSAQHAERHLNVYLFKVKIGLVY